MKFSILDQRNAEAFFSHFMNQKEAVLENFRREIELGGGPKRDALNFSEDSLLPLWTWLRSRMKKDTEHPPESLVPLWYAADIKNSPHRTYALTLETARLLDGLTYYYGETHIKNLAGLSWQIGSTKPLTMASYRPCIIGKYLQTYPLWMTLVVVGIAQRADDDRNTDDSLLISYLANKRDYEAAKAYYHARGDFSLEELPPASKTRKRSVVTE